MVFFPFFSIFVEWIVAFFYEGTSILIKLTIPFFVYFRYMPIIPMVLVNGSEGIGTGWSSYIPNYNPRDIIENIRRLLKGDTMEPMDPWYRWFKGTIEKTAKEAANGYTVSGIIEEVNETTLKITELPIRRWTQDYKEFLESISSSNKECKDPLIEVNFMYLRIMTSIKRCLGLYPVSHEKLCLLQDFGMYCDDVTVDFEIFLTRENLVRAKQEGLLKKFKLTTSISTSNMHLFDPKGVIKKYDTPEQSMC